ncbi:hypothetical protein HYPSUDRAFT_206525 [Hypholoma sublateritium FD-334 SS-4]|uniref:Uncharacterized protein n=1 Tax=Hypholoma sublateritium (strain FD-334 SS-4) TaxID=945553 RepID=A0A0D2NDA5_HYPSF|nr:hypothetical protein HYPSUDRAFT_206525 [Hypholoma sublateritium FD-334 SS-4]
MVDLLLTYSQTLCASVTAAPYPARAHALGNVIHRSLSRPALSHRVLHPRAAPIHSAHRGAPRRTRRARFSCTDAPPRSLAPRVERRCSVRSRAKSASADAPA